MALANSIRLGGKKPKAPVDEVARSIRALILARMMTADFLAGIDLGPALVIVLGGPIDPRVPATGLYKELRSMPKGTRFSLNKAKNQERRLLQRMSLCPAGHPRTTLPIPLRRSRKSRL